jgi:hypothetical protein
VTAVDSLPAKRDANQDPVRRLRALPLPVADATRSAWPDLNPCIERLRVKRIAVPPRDFRSHRGARPLHPQMRHADNPVHDDFGFGLELFGFGLLGLRLRAGLVTRIVACLDACIAALTRLIDGYRRRLRREFGRGPKRLRTLGRSSLKNSPAWYSPASDPPLHASSAAQMTAREILQTFPGVTGTS